MQLIKTLYQRTLCSVWFGIALMVLVGAYIAVGSGLPAVRAYFELNDLAFFNAWPLRVLMVLLVTTLAVITFQRIPFTPPRYGVWMVHAGIIVLIYGMFLYYSFKVEGLAIVPLKGTASRFYLNHERALYMRLNGAPMPPENLPSLPRYHAYAPSLDNSGALNKSDLKGIVPLIAIRNESGVRIQRPLNEALGWPDPLKVDVVEYWPYAEIMRWVDDKGPAGAVGLKLSWPDDSDKQSPYWILADDPIESHALLNDNEIEVRKVDAGQKQQLLDALTHMHTLTVTVGDFKQVLHVSPGEAYPLGQTGYVLTVEDFDPAFPTMAGEIVPLLTLKVKSPAQEFRRQLIPGREKPTDWKLGERGSGPLGKRQDKPLDETLKIDYAYSDPMNLMPQAGLSKQIFLVDGQDLIRLGCSRAAAPVFQPIKGGQAIAQLTDQAGHTHRMQVEIERGMQISYEAQAVPENKRQRDEAGMNQVVMLKVSIGNWSQKVAVPYRQFAMETPWDVPEVQIPGTNYRLQFVLGNSVQVMPALVTLEKFELVNYPGGNVANTNLFRDFQSFIRVDELDDSRQRIERSRQAVVKLNTPFYFGRIGDSYWTLFQAQWDRENQQFTVLGVGNRPGVWVMLAGSILMAVGLLWAFYLKPVLVAQMKAQALAEAMEKKGKKQVELAGVR